MEMLIVIAIIAVLIAIAIPARYLHRSLKKAERQQTLQMYVLLMHRFLRKCCSEIRRLP